MSFPIDTTGSPKNSVTHKAQALYDILGKKAALVKCIDCQGTGQIKNSTCPRCCGQKKVWNQAGLDAIALREYFRNHYQPAILTKNEPEAAKALESFLNGLNR